MKVRIDLTLQVDPDRWRVVRGLPEDTNSTVRHDVKSWAESQIVMALADERILITDGS
ncbi:hypothetical protein HWB51_gp061 [Mycobacterium phage Cuke]|uniref:Uncharacterized protein n=1 Tax=Mycobacterium phage Cuke TaxID=2079417 RepID=A0A2L1IWW4_9CAUD|nr:hypothetical protein HWB51_gp061 [Mycobacterium phage Cuke]AVD99679.1 hypothetical protein SEA_CUKE_61 [Mycobacterium phage Cuke]